MSRDPLNDLDTELRGLLSVEPSPQFEAKVRARISAERMKGGGWSLGWPLAIAAAVVLAIVSGALMFKAPSSPALVPPPVVAVAEPPAGAPIVEPPSAQPRAPDTGTGRARPRARTGRVAAVPREPEVLVDVRQRANVGRLIAMARAGLLKSEDLPQAASGPVDLVVEPLRIPAIGGESKH
jgi:hypothetical protein